MDLGNLGKLQQAIETEGQKLKAVCTFIYQCRLAKTDELAAYKVRYEYRNLLDKTDQKNSKTFRFFDLEGNPKLPDGMVASQFHLFGWDSIGDAQDVLVVEGEECVKALIDEGFPAVSPMTTGRPCEEAFKVLKDRSSVGVWADSDPPGIPSGEARFSKTVEALQQVGQKNVVRIIWRDAQPFGDAVDAINQGVNIRELFNDAIPVHIDPPRALNGSLSAPSKLKITRLSEVTSTAVQWLWKDRIALGKNTIISGDPNVGKSWLTLDISTHVSTGRKWPDGANCDVGNVLLITAEDGLQDTVTPRLIKLGADLDRIRHLSMEVDTATSKESLTLGKHLSAIEEVLISKNIRLLVIDPVTAVVGNKNSYKATDVRQLMTPVTEMAERTKTSIVTVMHNNKTSSEFNAMYRVSGSGDFVAVARSVFMVSQHPDNDDLKIFSAVKSNLSYPASPLAFEISQGSFQWSSEPVEMTARDLLLSTQNIETTSQMEEAVEFLAEILKYQKSVPATEAFAEAGELGIAEKTLKRAKAKLKVKSRKTEKGLWVWELDKRLRT